MLAQAHFQRLDEAGFLRGEDRLCDLASGSQLGAAVFVEAVEGRFLPTLNPQLPAVLAWNHGFCHRSRRVWARCARWHARGLGPALPAALLPTPLPHRCSVVHG